MPFNNNVGMHDASWRSEFGRNIYKTNGSHGCINLPYSVAEKIYGYVEKNTPVICYHLPGTEPEPLPEIPLEMEPDLGTELNPESDAALEMELPPPTEIPEQLPTEGQ